MKKILVLIIVLMLVVISILYWRNNNRNNDISIEQTKETQYQFTEVYIHPTKNFSFRYPKGFTVASIPIGESENILIQNISAKMGVQINMTPFQGEDIDITSDIIKSEIPDMKISESQEVSIGNNRKGLAFVSDNEGFGGKSREVWFVFRGSLYQISTYYEFDEFLKDIFATWKFE